MRGLAYKIYMAIVIKEDMSMSEIQADFEKVSPRTIIRAVQELVQTGQIEHKKIHGKGKRPRYSIKEENTKQDLTMRCFDQELVKLKIYEPIRATITQRELSAMITEEIKFYRKEFTRIKDNQDAHYYLYHIAKIGHCLEWNMKLTLAINSGMLGGSPNKLNIAQRNKERYEEFLQKLIFNIKKYDEELGNKILRAIYNKLEDTWLLEKINLD